MNLRHSICVAAVGLASVGCVNSETGDEAAQTSEVVESTPSTTTGLPDTPTTDIDGSSTSASADSSPTTVEPEPGVFRIAPAGDMPGLAIRYGPEGVFHPGHTAGETRLVDGPVSAAIDTYETGIVYQRPDDNRRVFVQSESGDQELLVAAENQTIRLVGVRVDPTDESFHVLYVRRTSSNPEDSSETLRSYNMQTGEVTEILQTGGWESGTSFSFIESDLAVGQWSGEAFTATHIVNVATGEIEQRFPEEAECFDGEQAPGCLPFTVATLAGNTMYGFGVRPNDEGLIDAMALYEFDIQSSVLTELISFPWDNGLYYPADIWVRGDRIIVGLSSTLPVSEGEPLPALIYSIETGQASTSPLSGYFRSAFIS